MGWAERSHALNRAGHLSRKQGRRATATYLEQAQSLEAWSSECTHFHVECKGRLRRERVLTLSKQLGQEALRVVQFTEAVLALAAEEFILDLVVGTLTRTLRSALLARRRVGRAPLATHAICCARLVGHPRKTMECSHGAPRRDEQKLTSLFHPPPPRFPRELLKQS